MRTHRYSSGTLAMHTAHCLSAMRTHGYSSGTLAMHTAHCLSAMRTHRYSSGTLAMHTAHSQPTERPAVSLVARPLWGRYNGAQRSVCAETATGCGVEGYSAIGT